MSDNKSEKANVETEIAPPLVPKRKKKKKWLVIPIVILVIGALSFFFRKPILNIARNIPFVGQLIGAPEEKEEALSPDELKTKVSAQEKEIDELKNQIAALESSNDTLKEKNDSLKQYESMYTDFMNQKNTWDESVAKTNPDLFIEQFEKTYPDNAERIYSVLKGEKVLSDQQKQVAKTIGAMEEDKAAAALEKLITTDPELIQTIFNGMSKDSQAAILSEMSSEAAAQVIKLISPDEIPAQ